MGHIKGKKSSHHRVRRHVLTAEPSTPVRLTLEHHSACILKNVVAQRLRKAELRDGFTDEQACGAACFPQMFSHTIKRVIIRGNRLSSTQCGFSRWEFSTCDLKEHSSFKKNVYMGLERWLCY